MRFLGLLVCLSAVSQGSDITDAVADRAKLRQTESSVDARFFYFSFSVVPEDRREQVLTAFKYAIGSTTHTAHVESFLPVAVTPTLYRIDLAALGWKYETFRKLMSKSKYKRAIPTTKAGVYEESELYLVNHPWFIMELLDSTESRAYNELLYGKADPTKDDFFQQSKTISDPDLESHRIEGNSGVAVVGVRNLFFVPNGLGTMTTHTGDRFEITRENSPLQSIDKGSSQQNIDASEAIYGHEIFSSTRRQRGLINRYWLGDGAGKFTANGDERAVSNAFSWRGHHTIITPGGCVACHEHGLNPVTLDFFRQYVKSGGQFKVKDKAELVRLERQLLLPITRKIERYNEDFAIGIELLTGLKTNAFVNAYLNGVAWFDAPITLEQAAREMYVDAETLRLAIAINDPYKLHEGFVRLASGIPIERSLWEGLYFECSIYIQKWKVTK